VAEFIGNVFLSISRQNGQGRADLHGSATGCRTAGGKKSSKVGGLQQYIAVSHPNKSAKLKRFFLDTSILLMY